VPWWPCERGCELRRIEPQADFSRARVILLAFIYFYLLLIAGAFGNVVVSTAISLKAAPMAWLLLTIGGILAGQMIYRWKKDIILTTVVCVLIAMAGIALERRGLLTKSSVRAWPQQLCGRLPHSYSAISPRSCPSGSSLFHQLRRLLYRFLGLFFGLSGSLCLTRISHFLLGKDSQSLSDALADSFRHHCLRRYFRMAQHCVQLRNRQAARK